MKEMQFMARDRKPGPQPVLEPTSESTTTLLRELVSILRENRTELREEWAKRITESP